MSMLFIAFGVAHAALAVVAFRRYDAAPSAAAIVGAVAAALAYDNLVVGLGRTIGAGDVLEALSWGRFLLHALVTPTLFVAAQRLGTRAEDGPFGFGPTAAVAATVAGIAISLATGLIGIELVVEHADGVVRYADAEPIVPVASIAVVIVTGLVGWRLRQAGITSALLVASVVMFLGSAAPSEGAPMVGNLAEVVFVLGLVRTLHAVAPSPRSAVATALEGER